MKRHLQWVVVVGVVVGCASSVQGQPAGFTGTFGAPVTFATHTELASYGFLWGPSDGTFGAIPGQGGAYTFFGTAGSAASCAGSPSVAGEFPFTGTLDRVNGSNGCTRVFGPGSGPTGWVFDKSYAGGGQVVRFSSGGKSGWLIPFHGEFWWQNPATANHLCKILGNSGSEVPCFYSGLGLAVSTDQGKTFEVAGQILQPSEPLSVFTGGGTNMNVGYGSLIVADANGKHLDNPPADPNAAYFYLFYMDLAPGLPGVCSNYPCIGVARATYAAVTTAALSGAPHEVATLFRKYDGASWSQPATSDTPDLSGTAGKFAPLWTDAPGGQPGVIYDQTYDVYLAVYQSGNGVNVRASNDLIHWSGPIGAGYTEAGRSLFYPTLIGETGDPTIGGPEPRVYFSSFPTGKFPDYNTAVFESVPLTLSRPRVRRHLIGGPSNSDVAVFYVATDGNDAWSGTLPAPNAAKTDGPFATFDHARAAVRSLDKTGLRQVVVEFRAGTYYLPATEQFTSEDSGSPSLEIVYQNYPGEAPVISGGMRVRNWTNVSGNTWKTTLPASTKYFENLFYNGVRRLRPRLGGYLGTYYRFVGPIYLNAPGPPAAAPEPNCSIYVSGKGWECFDRFEYNPADPIASTWKNLAPPTGNPCGDLAGNAALVGDIELLVFEKFEAAKLHASCVDAANHVFYLTGPTVVNPGFADALGFIPQHRYLVENVEDQLTQPGQWFLDRSVSPWRLTYLANPGENPNTDTVVVPQLAQVVVASNLQYVTFQGLTFEHDNYTVPAAGEDPDLKLGDVTAAVSFQNSQHITFDSGIVAHTSGAGLDFTSCVDAQSPSWCVSTSTAAVTSDNTVENSAFYDLGLTGVRVGVEGRPNDSDANIPQFTLVQNNVVEGYGRVFPGSYGITQGQGHDNTYTHDDIYDGYRAAVGICLCSGFKPHSHDNMISFNHAHDLLQGIMNDGGSLYIQARNSQGGSPPGNRILNNKVHDVSDASALDADGYGGDGIYIDTQTGLVDVENNLVYRVSGSTMNFAGAPQNPDEANTIKNNIFAFGRTAMLDTADPFHYGVPSSPIPIFTLTNNLFYFDRNAASSPSFHLQAGCTYSAGFPFTEWEEWDSNLYWRTDGGFASDPQAFHVQPHPVSQYNLCFGTAAQADWTNYTFGAWQTDQGEDTHSVVRDPGFRDPTYPADDFSLLSGSPGVGFVLFDANQAGRSNPVIKPPAVPATFPTKTFNPATDY
ncbi:MAG: right-handed parallel beta-helix repeat-containing protein [Thermoanaerobaculales bacterium]